MVRTTAHIRGGLIAALLFSAACNDGVTSAPALRAPAAAAADEITTEAVSHDLRTLIETIDNSIIANNTNEYDVPTATQTGHFRAAVDSVLAGRVAAADALLDQYGYDVTSIRSSVSGDSLVLFRERTLSTGKVARGWGTYLYNPSPTRRRVDVHVNHPIDDEFTEDIAIDLYQRNRARWFFMAGARRAANTGDAADMARRTDSVFHQLFTKVAAANVRTLSIHGFLDDNHPTLPLGVDHVLSNGRSDASTNPTYTVADQTLRTRLRSAGFIAGLYDFDAGYDELSAFPNPQGRHANNLFGFGRWMSIETERGVRETPASWGTMNTILNQWIIDFPA